MTLLFREMQGFVHFIRKKCIFTHGTSKVGSANQIRMKTQCITLRLEDFTCIFYSNDLSRCKTDNRSFLIIIPLSGDKSNHSSSRLSEKPHKNRKYVAYAASVSLLKDLSHLLVDARFLHQAYHHIQLWYRNLIILFSSGDI